MGKFSKIPYYNIPIHVHVYPSSAQLAHCVYVHTCLCSHQLSAHTHVWIFLKIFRKFYIFCTRASQSSFYFVFIHNSWWRLWWIFRWSWWWWLNIFSVKYMCMMWWVLFSFNFPHLSFSHSSASIHAPTQPTIHFKSFPFHSIHSSIHSTNSLNIYNFDIILLLFIM